MTSRAASETEAGPPPDPEPKRKRLGNYEIECELGHGAMGVVYKARHVELDCYRALKCVTPELSTDDDFKLRFKREARLAAKVSHENVVIVHDAGETEGRRYMAMEFIENGRDLKQVLDVYKAKGEQMPVREALDYIRQAAKGLAAIHEVHLVHRDIKPANILVDSRGTVRVTDFGLARPVQKGDEDVTRVPLIVGSYPYISPEQCEFCMADEQSDVYSLGITLYELLSGKKPYTAQTPYELVREANGRQYERLGKARPGLDDAVIAVVNRMMDPVRKTRTATAREAAQALELCLRAMDGDSDVKTLLLEREGRVKMPPSRRRILAENAICVLVVVAFLSVLGDPLRNGPLGAVWHTVNDAKYAWMAERPAHPDLMLVDLQRWGDVTPQVFADLIREIARQGAAVIGLDFDLSPPVETIRMKDKESLGLVLAPAFEEAGNVVLASTIGAHGEELKPITPLGSAVAALGFINVPAGIRIREAPLYRLTSNGRTIASLSVMMAQKYAKDRGREQAGFFPWLLEEPDVARRANHPISFGCIDNIRVHQVMPTAEGIEELGKGFALFRDKIVLVGSSHVEDWHSSPLWGEAELWEGRRAYMPGLVLQGVILDNLLTSHGLASPPWWLVLVGGLLLAALGAGGGLLCGPRFLALAWVVEGAVYLFVSMVLLRTAEMSLPAVGPLVIVLLFACLGVWRRKYLWKSRSSV